jgi:type I restriction enzyme S subunit
MTIKSNNSQLPLGWKWKKLAEITNIFDCKHYTPTYVSEGIPLIKTNDLVPGFFIFGTTVYVSREEYETLTDINKPAQGDIVFAREGSFGVASYIKDNREYAIGQRTMIIRCDLSKINPIYLTTYINSPLCQEELLKVSMGTTVKRVNVSDVKELQIAVPPLSEQKRIAAILEKCDRLRRTRRYSLQLSETFLQSAFLEMFGNPITNPKNWDIEDIGSQIISIRYGTSSPPEYQKNGIPFIRATNIKKGFIQSESMVYISENEAQKIPKCKVKPGDLIIVRSGVNTGDSAVVTEVYDGAYAAYDLVVELPKTQAYYYNFLINSDYGKAIIEPLTRRAGQPHINAEQVSSLRFPLPPLPLQEKFAQIVQKYERFRTQQREAERQTEHLFQTLLYRAFRGELTSSDSNELDISALSAENHPQQPKPKSTDKPENLPIPATQPQTNALQLTLPGLE